GLSSALKKRAKHAVKTPAVVPTSPTPARSPASNGNTTCYLCKQPGHFANSCPQRSASGLGNPSVHFATIIPAKADDHPTDALTEDVRCTPTSTPTKSHRATPTRYRPFDAQPITIPVLLDGQRHLAGLDTGASRSLIAASLAADLGKVIQPHQGHITFA